MMFKSLVTAAALLAVSACNQGAKHGSTAKADGSASDGLDEVNRNRFINAYLEQQSWAVNSMVPTAADSVELQTFMKNLRDTLKSADAVRAATAEKLGTSHNDYPMFFDLAAKKAGQLVFIKSPIQVLSDVTVALRGVAEADREAAYYKAIADADQTILTSLEKNIAPLDIHGDWAEAIDADRERLHKEIDSLTNVAAGDTADAAASDADSKDDSKSSDKGADADHASQATHGR